jgi:hypothetical protein
VGYKIDRDVLRIRGQLGVAVRDGNSAEEAKARRDLAWAKVEAAAKEAVKDWPLPTPEQRDRILGLLKAGEG